MCCLLCCGCCIARCLHARSKKKVVPAATSACQLEYVRFMTVFRRKEWVGVYIVIASSTRLRSVSPRVSWLGVEKDAQQTLLAWTSLKHYNIYHHFLCLLLCIDPLTTTFHGFCIPFAWSYVLLLLELYDVVNYCS